MSECKHTTTHVLAAKSSNGFRQPKRVLVTLCDECGMFSITIDGQGVEFILSTDEQLEAAERHLRPIDELDYLRFFHKKADFGPADSDVVMAIQRAYEATGKQVPATWKYE